MTNLDGAVLDEFTQGINAPEGPEDAGKVVVVNEEGDNFIFVPPEEVFDGGGSLPPGTYAGQPAAWNGAAWAPTSSLKVDQIQSRNGFELGLSALNEDGVGISGLGLGPNAVLSADGTVSVYTGAGGIYQTAPGLEPVQHYFGSYVEPPTNVVVNLRMGAAVDDPTIGFLGAAPVTRRSITGTTTQEQVDSIVAALVALGLATDDR
jgi:hypothetical protein